MVTSTPLSFSQFLSSQLWLEQLVPPSGSADFSAFVADLYGSTVQVTVGPQINAAFGFYWAVTVTHQEQPVAVRRTQVEAFEAAQEVRNSIGGVANV